MLTIKLAVIQMQMTPDTDNNIETATKLVRQTVVAGAQVILLPELLVPLYFCQLERESFFFLAQEQNIELLKHFQKIFAKKFQMFCLSAI